MRQPSLLLLLAAVIHPVQAAAVLRQPPAGFDAFVGSEMAARRIPGLSIGYAQDGITWARGYGFADLENQVPARADSSYRLASVTKPMTATAVMRLVEQGKIELDAEVQAYVPYFPRKPYPITVRQLLGHLGGINAYVNPAAEQHFKERKDTRQSLAVFQDFDLVAEPGTRFRYTSYGYNLLGAVIEGASGQSYGDYMRSAIWGPLGMASTRLDDPLALIPHRVRGYQLIGPQLQHSEFIDISSRFSAGGARSSVADMLRFGQGVSQGRMLSPASLAMMGTSMTTRGGETTGYGMGWQTYPVDGKFVISHDGMQPETSTYLFVFPSRRLSIAVAANLQRIDLTAFAARLFESVTGEAWQLTPYIRQPAHRPYYRAMQALYNEGRSHAEAGRPPISGDAVAISMAFAAINDNAAAATVSQLRLAGSTMAQALARSGMKLQSYSNIGAIGFARDYIALYRRSAAIPQGQRFSQSIEQAVAALHPDWSRNVRFAPRVPESAAAIATLRSEMQKYRGAQAYPDYTAQLREGAFRLLGQGRKILAMQAAQLAVEAYGDTQAAQSLFGMTAILSGNREAGERALRAALSIEAGGSASASALNALCYEIAARGVDAIPLLLSAVELHPRDANLRDTLGEFYARAGADDQAVLAYRQALALDPQYPNAAAARQVVDKSGR
ncbi:CubicO group peptidase, beta-lactamase class C family [Duganella sp. CF458]|uniref:serine hydrolase domain-containing protein n=1 Tax=Duganella sp. CF458 TaxID=1884368 RepID=UPI0008F27335|nr:serine hydrolase domain-containing protein [Duganella sp. CF458]SFG50619.1 CubicO group peptidase, beta-lactamase class C family [Duganella sp. CF458]